MLTTAQERAITQSGKNVVLFDNGTWQLEIAAPQTRIVKDTILRKTENTELFYSVSSKLSRFFGDEKGRIKCNFICSSQNGVVRVFFEWYVPVGNADKYFGLSIQDQSLDLVLGDATVVTVTIADHIVNRFLEKSNLSYYAGEAILDQLVIDQLLQQNTIRMKVNWLKNPEEYNIQNTNGLRDALTSVIN